MMLRRLLSEKSGESHKERLEKLIDEFNKKTLKSRTEILFAGYFSSVWSNDKNIIILELVLTLKQLEEKEHSKEAEKAKEKIKALKGDIEKLKKEIMILLEKEEGSIGKKSQQDDGSDDFKKRSGLNQRADTHRSNESSELALHEKIKESPKLILELVQRQENFSAMQVDSNGNTLLHLAFQQLGEKKITESSFVDLLNLIKWLHTKKVDFFYENNAGKTPLDLFFKKEKINHSCNKEPELLKRIAIVFLFIEQNKLINTETFYDYVRSFDLKLFLVILHEIFLRPKDDELQRAMNVKPLNAARILGLIEEGADIKPFLNAEDDKNILYLSISQGNIRLAITLLQKYKSEIKFDENNKNLLEKILEKIKKSWKSMKTDQSLSEEQAIKHGTMHLYGALIKALFCAGAGLHNQEGMLFTEFLDYKNGSFGSHDTPKEEQLWKKVRYDVLKSVHESGVTLDCFTLLSREAIEANEDLKREELTIWSAAIESEDISLLKDLLDFVDIKQEQSFIKGKSFFQMIADNLFDILEERGSSNSLTKQDISKKTKAYLELLKEAIYRCNDKTLLNNEKLIKCAIMRAVYERNNGFILELIKKGVNIAGFNLFSFYLDQKRKTAKNNNLSDLKFEENDFILLKAFRDAGVEISEALFVEKKNFLGWAQVNNQNVLTYFLDIKKHVTDFVNKKIQLAVDSTSETNTERWSDFSEDDKSKLEQFINEGFNVNTILGIGKTLLHVAIDQENIGLVSFLMAQGASDNIPAPAYDIENSTVNGLLEERRKKSSKDKEVVVLNLISALDKGKTLAADKEKHFAKYEERSGSLHSWPALFGNIKARAKDLLVNLTSNESPLTVRFSGYEIL